MSQSVKPVCGLQGQGHSEGFILSDYYFSGIFHISVNVHLNNILSTAEPVVTKLGMVVQHHGPECHVKRLVYYFQGQGRSEG